MKKYKFFIGVFVVLACLTTGYLYSADYTANKTVDTLADVSAAITAAALIPVQDMADTDKIGSATAAQIVDKVNETGTIGIGTATPAGMLHVVLAAGKPFLVGGDTIATLGTVAISNANPSVLTKDATIDDGLAVGDAVVVNSGTNATVGTYFVASIVANTSVTLNRQAATGACADGNVTYVNDPIVIETSSGAGEPRIVLPLQNDAVTPTLAWGDGDSGFYEEADDQITVTIGGVAVWKFEQTTGHFRNASAGRPGMYNVTTTSTIPGLLPNRSDPDTGAGWATDDQLSLIAGGVEIARATEGTISGLTRRMFHVDVPTTETTLTAEQCHDTFVTNQGATGEVDVILPALSYYTMVRFVVNEVQIFEINPPSGELFDLDGTDLDADDCVDSPAVVGSKLTATRMQIADASWRWSLDTVRGAWVDTGASD